MDKEPSDHGQLDRATHSTLDLEQSQQLERRAPDQENITNLGQQLQQQQLAIEASHKLLEQERSLLHQERVAFEKKQQEECDALRVERLAVASHEAELANKRREVEADHDQSKLQRFALQKDILLEKKLQKQRIVDEEKLHSHQQVVLRHEDELKERQRIFEETFQHFNDERGRFEEERQQWEQECDQHQQHVAQWEEERDQHRQRVAQWEEERYQHQQRMLIMVSL